LKHKMTVFSSPNVDSVKSVEEGQSVGETVKELENKRLKVNTEFKNVIKSLGESSEKNRGDVVKQMRGLKTRLSDSDNIESILLVRKYEKENVELKDQIKQLEEKVVGDELHIVNLTDENEDLKNQVSALKQMVYDLEKENADLKDYIKSLEGKTASDELIILNLTTENDELKEMIENLKRNEKGFIGVLRNTRGAFKLIYSSYNFVASCAYEARQDRLSVTASRLLTVAQKQLQNSAVRMKSNCEYWLGKVPLPQAPTSMEALLTSILPSRLVIPIKKVDTVLENIPIVKAVSGQTYKPTAESYCSQGQAAALAGQDAYAAHCGLVFTTWNSGKD